jgi:hypothetical protein
VSVFSISSQSDSLTPASMQAGGHSSALLPDAGGNNPLDAEFRWTVAAFLNLYNSYLQDGGDDGEVNFCCSIWLLAHFISQGERFLEFVKTKHSLPPRSENIIRKLGKQQWVGKPPSGSTAEDSPLVTMAQKHLEGKPKCCVLNQGGNRVFSGPEQFWTHMTKCVGFLCPSIRR